MATQNLQGAGMLELLGTQGQGQPAAQANAPAEVPPAEDAEAAAGRGRKRAATGRPQDERLAAVQEKNRKAQKRFRERQKEKMTTMEAEINEKDKVITSLREENSALAGRNAVLEKVLALREEQLKSFQPGGAAAADQGAALAALAYTPLSGASATGGFLALPPASMQAPMSLPVAAGLHGSGGGNAASAPQPAPVDSKQQTQAAGAWMEYVRELAQLTGEGEKPAGSAAERRLAQVVTLAAQLSARNSPTSGRGADGSSGAVDPARWQSVAANLGASDAQRREVRQLRDQHAARVRQLQAARQQLASNTQAAAGQSESKQADVVAELHQSVQEEADATAEFLTTVFTQVLTPQQFGRAAVQSFPFFVDGQALVNKLASEGALGPGIGSLAQLVVPSMPQASNVLFAQLGSAPQNLQPGGGFSGLSGVPAIGSFAGGAGAPQQQSHAAS